MDKGPTQRCTTIFGKGLIIGFIRPQSVLVDGITPYVRDPRPSRDSHSSTSNEDDMSECEENKPDDTVEESHGDEVKEHEPGPLRRITRRKRPASSCRIYDQEIKRKCDGRCCTLQYKNKCMNHMVRVEHCYINNVLRYKFTNDYPTERVYSLTQL